MQQPYNHNSFSKISKPSTALHSRSVLKNIKNFLCKKKIVNNHSIPSMHAERQITHLSLKHFFTLYPSLSPYSQTESQTEGRIHSLHVGWRNFFFQLWFCVSFTVLAGNRFWFTYLPMLLNKLFYELIFFK